MKKKKLFLFMALTSTIAGLTSCNVSNNNNSTEVILTTSTSSQAPVYNLEDNELSQKVFNEIKKTLPNITYDEFLLYGRKIDEYSDCIELEYSSIRISIALDGTFRSKYEYIYDDSGNLLTQADSKYENNAWVYTYKSEYTYNANGKKSTETYSRYINNEWIKIEKNIFINGKSKHIYLLYLNSDGTFRSKYEYTYDEKGNELSFISSRYENNVLIKTNEFIYINGESKIIYSVSFNPDGTIESKDEYTYDEKGNKLTSTYSKYENNALVYINKDEYTYDANGNELTNTYSKYENNAWVYIYKSEYTYDANGKKTTEAFLIYTNNAWVYLWKYEYTYDANGNQLTYTRSSYENNGLVYTFKYEYTYDANGNQLTYTRSVYENNAWVYTYKYEYTYDESGNRLTETRYDYIDGNWVLQD